MISLYAGGMTVRDIANHVHATLGTDLLHETVSSITDAVTEEILAWQARELDSLYSVIFLDAIETTWPQAIVQSLRGHLIRASTRFVGDL